MVVCIGFGRWSQCGACFSIRRLSVSHAAFRLSRVPVPVPCHDARCPHGAPRAQQPRGQDQEEAKKQARQGGGRAQKTGHLFCHVFKCGARGCQAGAPRHVHLSFSLSLSPPSPHPSLPPSRESVSISIFESVHMCVLARMRVGVFRFVNTTMFKTLIRLTMVRAATVFVPRTHVDPRFFF